jgi:hypothetical protein
MWWLLIRKYLFKNVNEDYFMQWSTDYESNSCWLSWSIEKFVEQKVWNLFRISHRSNYTWNFAARIKSMICVFWNDLSWSDIKTRDWFVEEDLFSCRIIRWNVKSVSYRENIEIERFEVYRFREWRSCLWIDRRRHRCFCKKRVDLRWQSNRRRQYSNRKILFHRLFILWCIQLIDCSSMLIKSRSWVMKWIVASELLWLQLQLCSLSQFVEQLKTPIRTWFRTMRQYSNDFDYWILIDLWNLTWWEIRSKL